METTGKSLFFQYEAQKPRNSMKEKWKGQFLTLGDHYHNVLTFLERSSSMAGGSELGNFSYRMKNITFMDVFVQWKVIYPSSGTIDQEKAKKAYK